MPYVVLDTNIVLAYVRGHQPVMQVFEAAYPPQQYDYIISVVTRAEMYVLARCNNWGPSKTDKMNELLNSYLQVRVDSEPLFEAYAQIDEFGQKNPNPLRATTARHMGKNDLWIAATANLYGAALATADKDFDHLANHFFPLTYVSS
ncbi:PIN domain-containing protein [Hymenobacter sp. H14-R3]|uniref:type II toxin-antitoxin system VapC family toxin n=1 Tax=Hymenobacter sp. H14-R3 TaxID=3046308 RepID=UPI0024BA63F9|nr:PIN domain-containing protein [Hymenobacter sp. H14-R3]